LHRNSKLLHEKIQIHQVSWIWFEPALEQGKYWLIRKQIRSFNWLIPRRIYSCNYFWVQIDETYKTLVKVWWLFFFRELIFSLIYWKLSDSRPSENELIFKVKLLSSQRKIKESPPCLKTLEIIIFFVQKMNTDEFEDLNFFPPTIHS